MYYFLTFWFIISYYVNIYQYVIANSNQNIQLHFHYSFNNSYSVDVEYSYELPNEKPIKALLYIAHANHHNSRRFWPCPYYDDSCHYLPIEQQLRELAVKRGYIVTSSTSIDKISTKYSKIDIAPVSSLLKYLYKSLNLSVAKIPLYFLGISSGAAFIGSLTQHLLFNHLTYQNYIIPRAIYSLIRPVLPQDKKLKIKFPPTVFVAMPRDTRRYVLIHRDMNVYASFNSSTIHYLSCPKSIDNEYFVRHGANMTMKDNHILHQAFIDKEILTRTIEEIKYCNNSNSNGWYIAKDPRKTHDWKGVSNLWVVINTSDIIHIGGI